MVKVWDPLVRLFHWSLVLSFAVAWVTAEGLEDLHEWAGYAAAALIGFRLLWGLIGPRYARFAQFVRGPGTILAYVGAMLSGTERRHIGHNPAGGAMILTLLAGLAATSWTGWLLTLPGYARRGWVGEGHEIAASLLLALVIAHIAGVILGSWRHRENLARAMLTGRKRAAEGDDVA